MDHSGADGRENRGPIITLPLSILVAAILISGSIFYLTWSSRQAEPDAPSQDFPTEGNLGEVRSSDVILGDPGAPVTFVEYGDYQCPFCARFYENVEPLLRENYVKSGKIKMVYRDLAFLGPESLASANAAACAKDQGKFWLYHDELFKAEGSDGEEHNGNLNRELFLDIAQNLQLNMPDFAKCVDENKHLAEIQAATREGQANGINATPTSLVNGQLIQGAQVFAYFSSVIEGYLEK